ncbi:MAG: hypothetical protein MJE77_17190 [Proteobacteria bacterium]|nr:hypothetical protein [Pseudomonadota bacterium]
MRGNRSNALITAKTVRLAIAAAACLTALGLASSVSAEPKPDADAKPWYRGLYVRAGVLHLMPLENSDEAVLSDVGGPASLAIENGPIAGSGAGIGATTIFAVTVGYVLPYLDGRLSVEGIVLAFPFPVELEMTAEGTLADESLAPFALDNIPTEVPALGNELGTAKALPPLATAVYNHFRGKHMIQPYVGAGLSYLFPISCDISNEILTEVVEPDCEIDRWSFGNVGFVGQLGVEVAYDRFFVNFDLKYIEKLNVTANVKNVYVKTPGLPLFETVRVGNTTAKVGVDPLIFSASAGTRF